MVEILIVLHPKIYSLTLYPYIQGRICDRKELIWWGNSCCFTFMGMLIYFHCEKHIARFIYLR